jgi:hypothetical protein
MRESRSRFWERSGSLIGGSVKSISLRCATLWTGSKCLNRDSGRMRKLNKTGGAA